MSPTNTPHGLVVRKDRQLLRTKIVATIGKLGNKPSYKDGVYDHNNTKLDTSELTYKLLVEQFYEKGVDIIRLNLSHLDENVIKGVFPEIKAAILECENEGKEYHKRIAILADLPGPKIRFAFPDETEVIFEQGETFTIHFEKKVPKDDVQIVRAATVYIDGHPLKESISLSDDIAETASLSGEDNGLTEEILQNAFGVTRVPAGGSFEGMMKLIEGRVNGGDVVLVFIGDGEVVLKLTSVNKSNSSCQCEVVVAKQSSLKGEKGFTLKGVDFNVPTFTETDQVRLNALLDADYVGFGTQEWEPVVGFIGLSFTQTAHDVMQIEEHIEQRLRRKWGDAKIARLQSPSIIAKIETRMGWKNSEYILDVADGIMVARGDLGLQMEIEDVPHIQKELIQLCNKRGKPVITATEMLKSMTQSIEPTRAESADVFNAILDGSDAVMTSEETASGKYPFHSIREAIRIAGEAELHFELKDRNEDERRRLNRRRYNDFLDDDSERINDNSARFKEFRETFTDRIKKQPSFRTETDREILKKLEWRQDLYQEKYEKSQQQKTTNCITQATCTLSESDHVKAIVAATTSGRTVRMISRLRPRVIIIGAAHNKINTRKLALSYGVVPINIGEVDKPAGTDGIFNRCREGVLRSKYLSRLLSQRVVVFTAGTKLGEPGTTDSIQMREISASHGSISKTGRSHAAAG